MTSAFFQQINYSSSTEDSAAEILALDIKPQSRVLCITGSGARALDLLIQSPAAITSVDFSAPQNYLLQLKLTGYQRLSYDEFHELLGTFGSNRSVECLHALLPHLPEDACRYWSKHTALAKNGLLYCGTWEKLLRWMSKSTWLRKKHVDGLLNVDDLSAQISYWEKYWSGWFFLAYLRVLSNRVLWTKIIREPGARLIPKDFDVAEYLHSCLSRMASHSLLRENPYANLIFYGRYTRQCILPIHLRRENFDRIKSLVDRITIRHSGLCELLNTTNERWDAFSLSDFSSYAPPNDYAATWSAIVNSANMDATFCERFFLVKRAMDLKSRHRNLELEQELGRIDHTCLYTFHAGHLRRTE